MSAPQLVLTPVTRKAIEAHIARDRPRSYVVIALRKEQPPVLYVPHGHVITYYTGYFRPKWLCRYLTVQAPAKWPNVEDVRRLMKLTGFKNELEAVYSWADRSEPRHVIGVLEPVDGDWSPLQSS